MTWNPTHRRLFVLIALGSIVSACLDAAPGPVEPARPAATLVGLAPELVTTTTQTDPTLVSATLGAAGGTLQLPGGHSLLFPVGALAQETTIHATLDGPWIKIVFGPHGLVFPESALPTLTLSYANGSGLTDADAPGLKIVYLNPDGIVQEILPTYADTAADVVRAQLRHFSTYALVTD